MKTMLPIQSRSIEARILGKGTTAVLFFHGFGSSAAAIPPDETVLATQNLQLLCFNRPGIGASALRKYTVWDVVADAKAILEHLQWKQCIVAGWSAGGLFAQAFAQRYPDTVLSLHLLSSAIPFTDKDARKSLPGKWKSIAFMNQWFPFVARAIFHTISQKAKRDPAALLQQSLRQMSPPDRVVAVGNRFYPLLQKAALEGFANNGEGVLAEAKAVSNACINYSRIRCPVHIWTGGQDNIWPVSTAEYLHRQLPQSQLHILRKGGHLHYLKEWERLVAAFAQQETAEANS